MGLDVSNQAALNAVEILDSCRRSGTRSETLATALQTRMVHRSTFVEHSVGFVNLDSEQAVQALRRRCIY